MVYDEVIDLRRLDNLRAPPTWEGKTVNSFNQPQNNNRLSI